MNALNPDRDLDWQSGYIWVQLTAHLKVDGEVDGILSLRRHNGEMFTAPRSLVERSYFPIRGGAAFKPRYNPHKSHCLKESAFVEIDEVRRKIEAGGAVLQVDAGAYLAIDKTEYERDYEAVAYPGVIEKPERPFPDKKPKP